MLLLSQDTGLGRAPETCRSLRALPSSSPNQKKNQLTGGRITIISRCMCRARHRVHKPHSVPLRTRVGKEEPCVTWDLATRCRAWSQQRRVVRAGRGRRQRPHWPCTQTSGSSVLSAPAEWCCGVAHAHGGSPLPEPNPAAHQQKSRKIKGREREKERREQGVTCVHPSTRINVPQKLCRASTLPEQRTDVQFQNCGSNTPVTRQNVGVYRRSTLS